MERYDYLEAVKHDVREYIEQHGLIATYRGNREGLEEKLNDDLWCEDSVTGNASGSYTFNAWRAEEYLCHNLELLAEALKEFDCGLDYLLKEGVEAADVTIRCYLLGQAISAVLDEYDDELQDDDD